MCYHQQEISLIVVTNAIVDPSYQDRLDIGSYQLLTAMMIHSQYTLIANRTVMSTKRFELHTFVTFGSLKGGGTILNISLFFWINTIKLCVYNDFTMIQWY